MQGNEFKYYITDDNGNYYTADGMGNVTVQSTPIELRYAPREWETQKIKFKRTLTNFGVLKDFSYQVKFVRDGADILRYIYAIDGGESKANFVVHQIKHDTNTLDTYFELIRTKIDFSAFRTDKHYTFVNLIDDDIDGALRAQYDTEYEWLMYDKTTSTYDPDLIDFAIHDFNAYEKSEFIISTRELTGNERVAKPQTDLTNQSNNTGLPVVVNNPSESIGTGTTSAHVLSNLGGWIFWNNLTISQIVSIQGNIEIKKRRVTVPFLNPIELRIYDETGAFIIVLGTHTFTGIGDESYVIPVNTTFVASPNIKYYFTLTIFGTVPALPLFFPHFVSIVPSNLTLTYKKKLENSLHKGYMLNTVFRKLVEKVTNGVGNSIDGDLADFSDINIHPMYDKAAHILTSGQMLRKTGDKIYFKTSLKKFQQFIKTAYSMDIAIEQNPSNIYSQYLTCRYLTKLFDKNLLIGTPQYVKDLQVEHGKEYQTKLVNIGWQQSSENTATGYVEYNVRNEYGNKSARENSKLEITSDYITDLTRLEKYKNTPEGSTDNSSEDNEVCVFDCIANTSVIPIQGTTPPYIPPYILHRNITAVMSGVYDNSVYNIFFTPKRCALRNIAFISSNYALYNNSDFYSLVLNVTNKTPDLVTTNYFTGEGVISERTNIDTSQYTTLFKPFYIRANIAKQENILFNIFSNRFGYIEINYLGRIFKGFIWECEYTPDIRKDADIVLLAHPDSDPNLLTGLR